MQRFVLCRTMPQSVAFSPWHVRCGHVLGRRQASLEEGLQLRDAGQAMMINHGRVRSRVEREHKLDVFSCLTVESKAGRS